MEEPLNVRYTFMMMLAIADPQGYTIGTDIAIARRLNIPLNEFKQCVEILMRPDEDSNSKEHEGRRIIESDGERGYKAVNYRAYRELKDEQDRREYMRGYMKDYREKKTPVNTRKQKLAQLTHAEEEGKGEAEENGKAILPPHHNGNGVSEGKQSDRLPTTEQSKRIAALFNRRITTAWDEREVAAYRKIGTVSPDDLTSIERYYSAERAKGNEGRHRRDLGTFLNNFAGELDRARAHKPFKGVSAQLKIDDAQWRRFLTGLNRAYEDPARAMPYLRDEFTKWLKLEP